MNLYTESLTNASYGLCTNKKEFKKFLKKHKIHGRKNVQFIKDNAEASAHYLVSEKQHYIVLCIDTSIAYDRIRLIGLLVHEIVHAWQFCKEWMREQNPGNEIEAYAIQGMTINLTYDLEEALK